MAKKKENYKDMNEVELKKELASLKENVRSIHFKAEGAKPKNVKEVKETRKKIARILTELNRTK